MCNFQEIELKQQEKVDGIRRKYCHTLSSHLFSSLYIWKDAFGLSLHLEKDLFAVKMEHTDHDCFFFPCGSDNLKKMFISHLLEQSRREPGKRLELCYMSDGDASWLTERFPNSFTLQKDRDSYEYLYSTEEQIALNGSRYRQIRRKIRLLKKKYSFTFEALSESNVHRAKEVILQWNKLHSGVLSYGDTGPALRAVDAVFSLGMTGLLVSNGAHDCGLIIGSPISEDIYDIHVDKSSLVYDSLDFYYKNVYFNMLGGRYRWINMEEDLGIEGLREHKMRQSPVQLTTIWKGMSKLDGE